MMDIIVLRQQACETMDIILPSNNISMDSWKIYKFKVFEELEQNSHLMSL
jgi:hypothetical protein